MASLFLGALGGFVGLSVAIGKDATMPLDIGVLTWIHSVFPTWLEGSMMAVTALGYYSVVAVALAVTAYLFYRAGSKPEALLLPVCALGSMVLATTIKNLDHRTRPHLFRFGGYHGPSSYAFPSGHATIAAGFWGDSCCS